MPEVTEDICGFCGLPGADKIPHPIRWPDEQSAGTEYVHAECEDAECKRASDLCQGHERDRFLRDCGNTSVNVYEGDTFRWRVARCNNCEAQGGPVRIQTYGEGILEEWEAKAATDALAAWNQRTPS